MKDPETYEELNQAIIAEEQAGTNEVGEWIATNRAKYTDLIIAKFKTLPRNYFDKASDEVLSEQAVHHWLNESMSAHRRGKPDAEEERYWDEFCKYFQIKRATLYAAQRTRAEEKLREVVKNDESTMEDVREAYRLVEIYEQLYHEAKDHKKILEKHRNVERAKQLYDEILDGKLAEAPGPNFILKLSDLRPSIITEVMHRMRIENHSKSPSRPTVDSWLKSYREL